VDEQELLALVLMKVGSVNSVGRWIKNGNRLRWPTWEVSTA
jgi:hypothetical protein